MSERTINERLARGEIVNVGGKLMAVCQECGKLIRFDKPLIGSMHICGSMRFP